MIEAKTQHPSPPAATAPKPHAGGLPWWVEPAVVFVVLGVIGLYVLWAGVLGGTNYSYQNYVSPFYSPLILLKFWPFSPAILVMWIPAGLRLSCYYYRKEYYRAFFWDPPACAIGELKFKKHRYQGETVFPYILTNLHRFFLYGSIVVLIFLWRDTVVGFIFDGHFGIGLGSLFLLASVVALTFFTVSCHSFRHAVGGCVDCFAQVAGGKTRHGIWSRISQFNEHHGAWAWTSLFLVSAADLYVRLVAGGVIHDLRFF
ncbi:MAG TPA: succinate dehydrogenase [Chloroflexota bacterium]|nr:succinate dehydrogenase [Chloroflexota bacterium]